MIGSIDYLFCWIPWFIRWVLSWLPKRVRLGVHEKGVKIRGHRVFELGPGTAWFNARWSEIFVENVKRKTLALPDQPLTTKDGKTIRVAGVLIYYVTNIKTWLVENETAEEAVQVKATRVLCDFVRSRDLTEIHTYLPDRRADSILTKTAQSELGQKFGVRIEELGFNGFAESEVKDLCHSGSIETAGTEISVEHHDEED